MPVVALGVDLADAQKYEILEMPGKEALHPQERVHADAAVLAHEKHGGRLVRIERGRVSAVLLHRLRREELVDLPQLLACFLVMPADREADRDDESGDQYRDPAARHEFLEHEYGQDAARDHEAGCRKHETPQPVLRRAPVLEPVNAQPEE